MTQPAAVTESDAKKEHARQHLREAIATASALLPKSRLALLGEIRDELEGEIAAIYRESLTAEPTLKVCDDMLADMLGEEPSRCLGYPIRVHGITIAKSAPTAEGLRDRGAFVAVRPVCENADKKTYLGVYLGDLPTSATASYEEKSGVLAVRQCFYNPAIWVPDLKRIVFGYESWWGVLKKPDDLRQISDADIQNVWYVQALKQMRSETA